MDPLNRRIHNVGILLDVTRIIVKDKDGKGWERKWVINTNAYKILISTDEISKVLFIEPNVSSIVIALCEFVATSWKDDEDSKQRQREWIDESISENFAGFKKENKYLLVRPVNEIPKKHVVHVPRSPRKEKQFSRSSTR